MTKQQLLSVAAISVLISSFGVLTLDWRASAFGDRVSASNLSGLIAQNSAQPNPQQGQRRHSPIDFAAAASKLGITEAQLREALGVSATPTPGQRHRLDIPGAATKLGITEQQLVQALGIPPRRPRPNFAAAATRLGVTEQQLKDALGVPANPPSPGSDRTQRPPRPDFAAAATRLGVTEQQLKDALGIPPRPPQGDRPATPPSP